MNEDHVEAMRETGKHIRRVQTLMAEATANLTKRSIVHDESKWGPEEWPHFAEATARLRGITYGSPEYKASLDSIRPAIDHHQQNNTHHPEFWDNGVKDMTLLDLIEMLADWKAAGERHADGSLTRSIEVNAERFKMPAAIVAQLKNTAWELGWLPVDAKLT
jgi:hypothetical protein